MVWISRHAMKGLSALDKYNAYLPQFTEVSIMSHHERLLAIGFKNIPVLDPSYFNLHNAVGYFILFSEKLKCYYSVYTINAKECTRSICEILQGKKRHRAAELLDALKGSVMEDWELYFKPGPLTKTTKQQSRQALCGYRHIRQGVSRIDLNQPMHVCFVKHRNFSYSRLVALPIGTDAKQAISEFLQKWRVTLDQGLRDGRISLLQYYKGCNHQAKALKDLRDSNYDMFGYGLLTTAGVFTRKQANHTTMSTNYKYTRQYFESLFAQAPEKKENLVMEG